MAQGEGSRNSPPPESTKPGNGAQTPPEKPFHDEINNLPAEKLMELFRKATGGVLNPSKPNEDQSVQTGERGNIPAAQAANRPQAANEQKEQADGAEGRNDDPHPDPINRIEEALKGENDLRLDKAPEVIQRAMEFLARAGIKDPQPRQINAVIVAEELLDRPGLGRKVGIIDQKTGKFVDITNFAEAALKKVGIKTPSPEQINALLKAPELLGKPQAKREIIDPETEKHVDLVDLWEKEIRGHMKFGGPTSDAYAVSLYKAGRAFYIGEKIDRMFIPGYYDRHRIAALYFQKGAETIENLKADTAKGEGIDINNTANYKLHIHDGLLAMLYAKAADSHALALNDKLAAEYRKKANDLEKANNLRKKNM